MKEKIRCFGTGDKLYEDYHDFEWGRPIHDDRSLFELLILEGAQAGLSWIIVLRRRDSYRKAFDNFDVQKIANYSQEKIEELMLDAGIIRNHLKIKGAVTNAKLFIEIQKEYGSFDKFIWGFVGNNPIVGKWDDIKEIPITTALSDNISKILKKKGFKFVGSTIIYSYLQAIGVINDHMVNCSYWDNE